MLRKFFDTVKVEMSLVSKGRLPDVLEKFDELVESAKTLEGPGEFVETIYTLDGAFDKNFDRILDSMDKRQKVFDALLVWEENNPVDTHAVCVYVEGLKIGYVTHLQDELVAFMKKNGRRLVSKVELVDDWRGGRIDLPESI